MQREERQELKGIWDTATQIEGRDGETGAISAIDRDQAIDEDTGHANYESYRITVSDRQYRYSAKEMKGFADTW